MPSTEYMKAWRARRRAQGLPTHTAAPVKHYPSAAERAHRDRIEWLREHLPVDSLPMLVSTKDIVDKLPADLSMDLSDKKKHSTARAYLRLCGARSWYAVTGQNNILLWIVRPADQEKVASMNRRQRMAILPAQLAEKVHTDDGFPEQWRPDDDELDAMVERDVVLTDGECFTDSKPGAWERLQATDPAAYRAAVTDARWRQKVLERAARDPDYRNAVLAGLTAPIIPPPAVPEPSINGPVLESAASPVSPPDQDAPKAGPEGRLSATVCAGS
jgi:hypothetical protein